MTDRRLVVVFAILSSALGCQSETPPDNLAGDSRGGGDFWDKSAVVAGWRRQRDDR